jgi:hypothetical protein
VAAAAAAAVAESKGSHTRQQRRALVFVASDCLEVCDGRAPATLHTMLSWQDIQWCCGAGVAQKAQVTSNPWVSHCARGAYVVPVIGSHV